MSAILKWSSGLIILLAIIAGVHRASVLYSSGVRSWDDYRNDRDATMSLSPVMRALKNRSILVGTIESTVLELEQPSRTFRLGRYAHYTFSSGFNESRVVIFVDGRATAAWSKGCTYDWTFFNATPKEVTTAVLTYIDVENSVNRNLDVAITMQPMLNEACDELGIPKIPVQDIISSVAEDIPETAQ